MMPQEGLLFKKIRTARIFQDVCFPAMLELYFFVGKGERRGFLK